MSVTIITIIIVVSILVYFGLMLFWMRFTFNYKNTLNYYICKRSLESQKFDPMHYVELAIIILTGIGLLTTLISQIQIWVSKRGK